MHREFDIIDSNDQCPKMEFLRDYATGELRDPEIRQAVQVHVPCCAICADILRRLRANAPPNEGIINRLATRTKGRWEIRQWLTAQGPEPGTIWRALPEAAEQESGLLVLILAKSGTGGSEVLSVVEVSTEISQAIEDDIILEREDTELPFRCMVRTSNRFPTNHMALDVCIGKLPEHWMQIVHRFCNSLRRFDHDIGFHEDVFVCDGYGNTLMRRRGVTSGVPVTNEKDSRLVFLRASMHKRRYLTREVKAALLQREENSTGLKTLAGSEPELRRLRLIRGGAQHQSLAKEPVVMAAQQQGEPEPGWPFEVEVDVEGLASPLRLRLKVDQLGFDLVVECLGPPEVRDVVVRLDNPPQEIRLNAYTISSLGPLNVFHLTSASSVDDILAALLAAGFIKPLSGEQNDKPHQSLC